jgi:hypothetical protein
MPAGLKPNALAGSDDQDARHADAPWRNDKCGAIPQKLGVPVISTNNSFK